MLGTETKKMTKRMLHIFDKICLLITFAVFLFLHNGKVEYDFVEKVVGRPEKGRGGRKLNTMRDALSDYRKCFGDVLADQGSSWLKLTFYVIRLRLDMLLVERLLRDFVKRSKWYISVLSKKVAAYSDKPSRLLLREVANFERKRKGGGLPSLLS